MGTQAFLLPVSLLFLLPLYSSLPQYRPSYSPFYGLPAPSFSYGYNPSYGRPLAIATHTHFLPGIVQPAGDCVVSVGARGLSPVLPAGVVQATQPAFHLQQF